MIIGNFSTILRLAAVPWLFVILVQGVALGGLETGASDPSVSGNEGSIDPISTGLFNIPVFVFSFIVSLVVSLWIVVGWHRFILLQEQPASFFPRWSGDRMLAYVWRVIILALVLIAVVLPMGLVFTLVGNWLSPLVTVPLLIGMALIASVISLRISLILPAAAIGRNLTLRESWEATSEAGSSFFWLAIIMFGCAIAVGVVQALIQLALGTTLIGMVLVGVVQGLLSLFNVSVLTTLYGHFGEGRELNA
jgi:hypothetical protein